MNATITVVCYQSKTLKNGEHPLMLRITKDRKRKFQSLGISVNPKHWDFVKNRPKANCPNREQIQKIILDKQAKLQSAIIEFNAEDNTFIWSVQILSPLGLLVHIFLLPLSQFRSSNGKEGHFEQKGVIEIIFIREILAKFQKSRR